LNLRSVLRYQEEKGWVRRISQEVDPELEISLIAQEEIRGENRTLIFERVKGSSMPVVMGVLSSADKIQAVLGVAPSILGEKLAALLSLSENPTDPSRYREAYALFGRGITSFLPSLESSLLQEAKPNLDRFPVLKTWPGDGGRFITFGVTVTPEARGRNFGVYRHHVFDRSTTGMHFQIERGGRVHMAEHHGGSLPAAILIGPPPALLFASVFPAPEGMDELFLAAFFARRKMKTARVPGFPAPLPVSCEAILIGHVPITERRREGPFGDHFGHYSEAADFPVFHIDRIYERPDPYYLAAVVGPAPQEDFYIGNAIQEIGVPVLKVKMKGLLDFWSYGESGFHHLAAAAIKSRYELEEIRVSQRILGEGQLSLIKFLLLVPGGTPVRDFSALAKLWSSKKRYGDILQVLSPTAADTLDFACKTFEKGSKAVLNLIHGENVEFDERVVQKTRDLVGEAMVWNGFLLVKKPPSRELDDIYKKQGVSVVFNVSDDTDFEDEAMVQLALFTRFCPHRDIRVLEGKTRDTMVIDSRWKEGFPAALRLEDLRTALARVDTPY